MNEKTFSFDFKFHREFRKLFTPWKKSQFGIVVAIIRRNRA